MTLPNFIIGGAMKAGTTSLHTYLRQHPQVYMSPIKEPRYFAYDPDDPVHVRQTTSTYPIRTLEQYLQLFEHVTNEVAIGETSPRYLISQVAPANLKRTIPDIRLIFSLRHPVDRLYSLYLMGGLSGSGIGDVYERCRPGSKLAIWARYSPYFEHWLDYFERSSMKILLLEELESNPQRQLKELFRFLEIDEEFVPDTSKRYNVGGVPKNRVAAILADGLKAIRSRQMFVQLKQYVPDEIKRMKPSLRQASLDKAEPMPADLAESLVEFYRDDVRQMQQLLDIDLSIWGIDTNHSVAE